MNVIALRPHGVEEWKDHSVAHTGEVTPLRCFGTESHFEEQIMAPQDVHRYDSDFSKRQVFPQLCKVGYSMWMCSHTLPMDLPIGLSAVNLLYSLRASIAH